PVITAVPSPVPQSTPVAPSAAPAPAVAAAATADVQLAEMAHRLETALRRPIAQPGGPAARRESKPSAPTNGPMPAASGGAAAAAPSKSAYENLEQEMASLLGRQSGKT